MNDVKEINLTAMPTPNPNAIKFMVNYTFMKLGTIDFNAPEKAAESPLANELFAIKGILGVMVGSNFISINKAEDEGWETILEPATRIIKDILANEETPVDPVLIENAEKATVSGDDSEAITKIKQILDEEIRPAIAMDGGDCQFHSFVGGILTLQLQGACSTCPASVMTLKMGIENRLKEDIPEIKEVVQLQ